MSCYTYNIILKLFLLGCLAIMRKTTKLIEGGHRGLQESIGIYVITSTVFFTFLTFFQYPKSREFLPRDARWCKARYCDRMSSVCLSVTLWIVIT